MALGLKMYNISDQWNSFKVLFCSLIPSEIVYRCLVSHEYPIACHLQQCGEDRICYNEADSRNSLSSWHFVVWEQNKVSCYSQGILTHSLCWNLTALLIASQWPMLHGSFSLTYFSSVCWSFGSKPWQCLAKEWFLSLLMGPSSQISFHSNVGRRQQHCVPLCTSLDVWWQ